MSSLEDDLRSLTVGQPTGDESPTPEPSDYGASSGSMSPLDRFIRDLDERKGKLPCYQEVTDIQTGVENVLKALLLEVEKENPFYKTTLINTGSYYEGTKVGKPDEFDYFVQLDNFSKPGDIRYEEMPHATVMVIPNESSFKKFRETNPECSDFKWKKEVKAPFVDLLNSKLAKGYEAYGIVIKASKRHLDRHGPAYSLKLEWQGGSRYKGMKISVDLSLAVKINSHSSSMDVDFDSQAGKVVESFLFPYYFAVSAYRERALEVPQTKLFEEHEKSTDQVSVNHPSDCRLRVSQSCLEQSLFLHFGPDSGPSICLRVLKVLRDITHRPVERDKYNYSDCVLIDESVAEFHDPTFLDCAYRWMSHILDSPFICGSDPDGNKWISSYALKTLVLLEWKDNPEDEKWSARNLSQRLLSITETLLHCLENKDKRLRSFFYKDYNVLPRVGQTEDSVIRAIDRVKVIHKCILSLRNGSTYSFEDCLQNITDNGMMAWQKNKLTRFLLCALRCIFSGKLKDLWTESVDEGKSNKNKERIVTLSLRHYEHFLSMRSLCNIYLQSLLDEISPQEELIRTEPEETRYEFYRVKQAKQLFKTMACSRMKMLDNLPSHSLWTQDPAANAREVGKLLHLLCENFKTVLESFKNKLRIITELRDLVFTKQVENEALSFHYLMAS